MRRVSLNQRVANNAATTDEVPAALIYITHDELEEPIRLSTDNTERLSTDPLIYGTRSTWMGSNPDTEPFFWIIASVLMPSDVEDAPASATLILDNFDSEIAKQLRSFTDLATVHIAGILSSSPDVIEVETRDMKLVSCDISEADVRLSLSRQDIEEEYYPVDRMTKFKFPGLHR